MFTFPTTFFGGSQATLTFLQASSPISATQASYTFSSVNLGTASADRYVLAVLACFVSTTGRSLTSATIGGSTATLHANFVSEIPTTADIVLTVAGLLVTAGTSANIVANYSGNMTSCLLATYMLTKWQSITPFGSGTHAANTTVASIATTLNNPQNGCQLVAVTEDFSDTITPSGFTSDNQTTVASFAGLLVGHNNTVNAETARSVSGSHGGSNRNMSIAALSWQ